MATIAKGIKKAQVGTKLVKSSRGSAAVGNSIKLDDKPKAKYTPTTKEVKNIKDATEMKNMRPVFKAGGKMKKAQNGFLSKVSKTVSGAADTAGKWIKAHQTGGDETDRQRSLPSATKTVSKKLIAKCGTKMKKK